MSLTGLPPALHAYLCTFLPIGDVARLHCSCKLCCEDGQSGLVWQLLAARDFELTEVPASLSGRKWRDIYQMRRTHTFFPLDFYERPLIQRGGILILTTLLFPFLVIYLSPRIMAAVARRIKRGVPEAKQAVVVMAVSAKRSAEQFGAQVVSPAYHFSSAWMLRRYTGMLALLHRLREALGERYERFQRWHQERKRLRALRLQRLKRWAIHTFWEPASAWGRWARLRTTEHARAVGNQLVRSAHFAGEHSMRFLRWTGQLSLRCARVVRHHGTVFLRWLYGKSCVAASYTTTNLKWLGEWSGRNYQVAQTWTVARAREIGRCVSSNVSTVGSWFAAKVRVLVSWLSVHGAQMRDWLVGHVRRLAVKILAILRWSVDKLKLGVRYLWKKFCIFVKWFMMNARKLGLYVFEKLCVLMEWLVDTGRRLVRNVVKPILRFGWRCGCRLFDGLKWCGGKVGAGTKWCGRQLAWCLRKFWHAFELCARFVYRHILRPLGFGLLRAKRGLVESGAAIARVVARGATAAGRQVQRVTKAGARLFLESLVWVLERCVAAARLFAKGVRLSVLFLWKHALRPLGYQMLAIYRITKNVVAVLFRSAATGLRVVFAWLKDVVLVVWRHACALASVVRGVVVTYLKKLGNLSAMIFRTVRSIAVLTLATARKLSTAVGNLVAGAFAAARRAYWETIHPVLIGVLEKVREVIRAVMALVLGVSRKLQSELATMVRVVLSTVNASVQAVTFFLRTTAQNVRVLLTSISREMHVVYLAWAQAATQMLRHCLLMVQSLFRGK